MQQLNRGMLGRYEIPEHIPAAVTAAQFGCTEALLGVADRLIDGANPALGIACVAPDGPASRLKAQDGLYTLLVRGYRGEAPVKQEVVVQSILRIVDTDAALADLAGAPGLTLALLDTADPALDAQLRRAAALLETRRALGLGGLDFLCLGERADCAGLAREALSALAPGAAEGSAFHPALADGLAFLAEADEAARQCAEMNYADAMLHIAEPYARLTVQAPAALAARLGLDASPDIRFVDDLAPDLALKHRLFDAGLFAMAAPGWLLGCDTLADCMRHERLRAFVGNCYFNELLPADPDARREAAAHVIQCFERFENPLNRNGILRAAHHLLARFARGALPLMRAWADERFEPPRGLSFALAATIMLYAGARPNAQGAYEVVRSGGAPQVLVDDPEALAVFATLSHDMPPEALAYAALADRELWGGLDLRDVEGLEARVALDIAALQRQPDYLPADGET